MSGVAISRKWLPRAPLTECMTAVMRVAAISPICERKYLKTPIRSFGLPDAQTQASWLAMRICRSAPTRVLQTGTTDAALKKRRCTKSYKRTGPSLPGELKRSGAYRILSSKSSRPIWTAACLSEGRLSDTKYIIRDIAEQVTIIRPHHPLQQQPLEVLRGGKRKITVKHPDGASMRIPREWTDADGVNSDSNDRNCVFTTEALRRLIGLVDALLKR